MENPRNIVVYDPQTKLLEYDGILFVARRLPAAPKFHVAAQMLTGGFEDIKAGTAHFFEHLPFGQTENFKNDAIFQYGIDHGGHVYGYTANDHTVFEARLKKGYEKEAVFAAAELVCRPVLDDHNVGRETPTILTEWAWREMNEELHRRQDMLEAAYGANAPQPVIGSYDSILSIKRSDIEDFYNTKYTAQRLIVGMEGDIEHGEMFEMAIKKFKLP